MLTEDTNTLGVRSEAAEANPDSLSEADAIALMIADSTPKTDDEKAKETEKAPEAETTEEAPEGAAEGATDEKTAEAEKAPEVLAATDDHVVTIQVDGKDVTIPVKDLKEAYGVRETYTSQAAELATRRTELDELGGRTAAVLMDVLTEAQENWQAYEELDWVILSRRMDDDAFEELRIEARAAKARFEQLDQKAAEFVMNRDKAVQKITAEQKADAARAIKAKVPAWSPTLETSVHQNALEAYGFTKDELDTTADARVLEALHDAYLYRQGKKVATEKLAKAPAKVLTSGKSDVQIDDGADKKAETTFKRFKASGREEDAIAAMLADFKPKR